MRLELKGNRPALWVKKSKGSMCEKTGTQAGMLCLLCLVDSSRGRHPLYGSQLITARRTPRLSRLEENAQGR